LQIAAGSKLFTNFAAVCHSPSVPEIARAGQVCALLTVLRPCSLGAARLVCAGRFCLSAVTGTVPIRASADAAVKGELDEKASSVRTRPAPSGKLRA
jgi:hypothetical protein